MPDLSGTDNQGYCTQTNILQSTYYTTQLGLELGIILSLKNSDLHTVHVSLKPWRSAASQCRQHTDCGPTFLSLTPQKAVSYALGIDNVSGLRCSQDLPFSTLAGLAPFFSPFCVSCPLLPTLSGFFFFHSPSFLFPQAAACTFTWEQIPLTKMGLKLSKHVYRNSIDDLTAFPSFLSIFFFWSQIPLLFHPASFLSSWFYLPPGPCLLCQF